MATPTGNGPNMPTASDRPTEAAPGAARDAARSTGDAARAAGNAASRGVEAERRTFDEGAQQMARTASDGLGAAKDMARQGAQATRQLADDGRRAGVEIANVWRDAWGPLFKAHMEATRWMDETWRHFTGLSAFPALQTARPFAVSPAGLFGAPASDVRETDRAYEIAIETPGMSRDDLALCLEGDLLTVSGQKVDRQEQGHSTYRVSERRFGRFARSFPIPPDADRGAIGARHEDGVLTITIPRSSPARQPVDRIEIR